MDAVVFDAGAVEITRWDPKWLKSIDILHATSTSPGRSHSHTQRMTFNQILREAVIDFLSNETKRDDFGRIQGAPTYVSPVHSKIASVKVHF